MAKNLFIVRSPLQVINAYEASQYFATKNNILVLIHNSTINNTDQTRKIVEMLNVWDEIIEIENKNTKFFQYVKLVKKLKKSVYENIFIGGFSTLHKIILANLKYKEAYVIDDGTATLAIQSSVKDYFNKRPLNGRELRFLFFLLKTKIQKKIHYFTFFNLPNLNNELVIKHKFEHTKKLYHISNTINDNVLYFLGQHLVQEGCCSREVYMHYLNQIVQKYPEKKIIYIPHRSENILDEIKELESQKFQIHKNEIPIELFFLSKGIYPSNIASFISTALYTLSTIFPDSNVESFLIPMEDLDKCNETVAICQRFLNGTSVIQTPLKSYRDNS